MSPSQTSSNMSEHFSLSKSRTVGRVRCDCFSSSEVITADLPQLWLRLINIDKQLMRCQAGTRPFPSCLPVTLAERKNDLTLAMSWPSFTGAQAISQAINYLYLESLSMVRMDYSHHKRNRGEQMFVEVLFFLIMSDKRKAIILDSRSNRRFMHVPGWQSVPVDVSINRFKRLSEIFIC